MNNKLILVGVTVAGIAIGYVAARKIVKIVKAKKEEKEAK